MNADDLLIRQLSRRQVLAGAGAAAVSAIVLPGCGGAGSFSSSTALDVCVQATIPELIAELTTRFGTTVPFVCHDLAVARTVCRRTVVLRAGRTCEEGLTDEVFSAPAHPYTRELIGAIPSLVGVSSHEVAPRAEPGR
jgi:ABC-type antimicrobial peptide transport system ATPase subunit